MKKRKAKYNRAADQRWEEANRDHRRYLSHRSRARSFIRDVATLPDLRELHTMIHERIDDIMENINFRDEQTIIDIAKECGHSESWIKNQLKGNGIMVYEVEEWIAEEKQFYQEQCDLSDLENWFENIGVSDWDELQRKLEAGKMGTLANGIENRIYKGKPFVMVTPL